MLVLADPPIPYDVASERPGVNVNRLLPSGPESYDPLSNMAHMTGIPVDVRRVEPADV